PPAPRRARTGSRPGVPPARRGPREPRSLRGRRWSWRAGSGWPSGRCGARAAARTGIIADAPATAAWPPPRSWTAPPRPCAARRDAGSLRALSEPPDAHVRTDRRRTRTRRTAGRKPEPGRRGCGRDRPGGAAVQRRAGPGFDRRPGAGAGDQQALRLPAALGQRREPAHLRLAAGAVGTRPAAPHHLIPVLQIALALAYALLAHLASARDEPRLAFAALLVLVALLFVAPLLRLRPWAFALAGAAAAGAWWLHARGLDALPLLLVPVVFVALV